ncbi:hypothetical protein [Actinophytocola sp.]|uniref:hypothetical protein n=1 Tax=Actinophytocola sp. TaxID=1872138 RepID=UPI002ED2A0D5
MDTDVNLDEMNKFASAVFGFAADIKSVAERASTVDYNVNTFGLIGAACTGRVRSTADRTAAGLLALYRNVYSDATSISDTALDFKNNEDTQTNRFRGAIDD